jgi:hypothetical protein
LLLYPQHPHQLTHPPFHTRIKHRPQLLLKTVKNTIKVHSLSHDI